jgi:hypothetical protein
MSEKHPQTLANHGRIDPVFHYLILPLLVLCFAFSIYFAVNLANAFHLWLAVLSLAVLLLAVRLRMYAIKVQDRIIRLEERVRLAALLQEPLRARIPELTERQLVALRFASDEEIPSLTEKTLQENLQAKAIKQAIRTWRPDYWRV